MQTAKVISKVRVKLLSEFLYVHSVDGKYRKRQTVRKCRITSAMNLDHHEASSFVVITNGIINLTSETDFHIVLSYRPLGFIDMTRLPFVSFTRRKLKVLILTLVTTVLAIICIIKFNETLNSDRSSPSEYPAKINYTATTKSRIIDQPFREILKKVDLDADSVIEGKCTQTYPQEAVTDFNTFDLYKGNMQQQANNGPKRPDKKSSANNKLNVFVLPMTHVDPGWLETFDAYSKETNQILDNMLIFLRGHSEMRFMWCEMVFFERWWHKLNSTAKDEVKQFIKSGQLEMTSGSWVMTDEASPFFPVTIDNIVEGQQFLHEQLGTKAKTIWSNDPFGYGSTVPYLFTKTGIRWVVINRIHHSMKNYLQQLRAAPFKWRQYFDNGQRSDVLTHLLPYTHYDILNSCGPSQSTCCEFDFKRITHFSCPGPKPVPITSQNVDEKAMRLEEQFTELSDLYETNNIIAVWGDDFRYTAIEEWYQQYDNLMPLFQKINSRNHTQIRFGTFTDYFQSVEKWYADNSRKPPTLSGDFFPYQCALGDIWTGYYTTRPFYKRMERELHALIRSADLLSANAMKVMRGSERIWIKQSLQSARRNLSLFQHHDAITGTSKKHVMSNYAQILFTAMHVVSECLQRSMQAMYTKLFQMNEIPLQYNQTTSKLPILIDPHENISVAVFNNIERKRVEVVELILSTHNVGVTLNGRAVEAQIEPYVDPNNNTLSIYFKLAFRAILRPLSTEIFVISYDQQSSQHTHIADILVVDDKKDNTSVFDYDHLQEIFNISYIKPDEFFIETESMKTTHSAVSGLITAIRGKSIGDMKFAQTVDHYVNSGGGPYVMLMNGDAKSFPLVDLYRFVIKGPVQQSAYIRSRHLTQKLALYNIEGNEGEQLHISMRVDIREFNNIELITRFSSDLDSNSTQFYTDSNGFQLLKREYNHKLPVSANYYPMPTAVVLQDDSRRISIVSNVEHGVSLFNKTTAEIMLDRIFTHDDGKGLGYGEDSMLNDNLPVQIGFTVVFERMNPIRMPKHFAYHTPLAQMALQSLLYKPVIFTTDKDIPSDRRFTTLPFPCDLQLITCRPIKSNLKHRLLILHRPGMDCNSKEDASCSFSDFTKIIKNYLRRIGATKVQQTTLNGVDKIGDNMSIDSIRVQIEPMDFISFIVTIE